MQSAFSVDCKYYAAHLHGIQLYENNNACPFSTGRPISFKYVKGLTGMCFNAYSGDMITENNNHKQKITSRCPDGYLMCQETSIAKLYKLEFYTLPLDLDQGIKIFFIIKSITTIE